MQEANNKEGLQFLFLKKKILKEGYVVKIPKQGFEISLTHKELAETHPNMFDRSLNRELEFINNQEYVYDIGNHSNILLLKEDLAPDSECSNADEGYKPVTRKQHGKVPHIKDNVTEKKFIKIKRSIPKHIIPYLKSGNCLKIKKVERSSGANVRIYDSGGVTLSGYSDDVVKAEEHLQKLVNQTKVEELCIKWDDAGKVIGTGGVYAKSILEKAGAHVNVTRIGHNKAQRAVIITGTDEEIKEAKIMITEAIKGKNNM